MTTQDILSKNIETVLPSKESLAKLMENKKITIYHGIDPSGSFIHLGHTIALWKLREFQDSGHKIILLIGDFTGMIGDPTDKSAVRKKLTREEVLENAKNYKEQAANILRFEGENSAEIKFNSEWLAKLNFTDIVELASNLTVQQMLERDFFQERLKNNKPIYLHEFLYPLMQGYDSVTLEVDAEIGGTDQTFNMLVGRTLLKTLKNKEKFVITTPLLEGLDGRKMSKSFGNYIAVADPANDMFGKVMSLRDDLIVKYFELTTRITDNEIHSIKAELEAGNLHPMDAKKRLAREIVKLYHSENEASNAQEEFEKVFQKRELPEETQVIKTENNNTVLEFLVLSNLVSSKSEAKRLIEQGGVELNGEKVADPNVKLSTGLLRIGKHRFVKVEKQ